ncbi:MAG: DnaT-like ssDNA-binding domain-containing protein, partial [Gammaproteobacteria bacterium]
MASSLLPERSLLLSPTLAATIGLEEAIMLQGLADVVAISKTESRPDWQGIAFTRLSEREMQAMFPFWTAADHKRILASLQSLDLVTIDRESGQTDVLWLAINDADAAPTTVAAGTASRQAPARGLGSAAPIPANWQPDENWLRQCRQQNIPKQFAQSLVPEFVAYWRDRGQARFSWGNAFYKHVLKEWRSEQNRKGLYERESTMSAHWQPSADALEIL